MLTNEEFEQKMLARRMTMEGAEIPDKRPVAPPVGYVKQPSMFEQVRSMVARELARVGGDDDESPEDAADMGDDEEEMAEALSKYERYDLEMELARRVDAENVRKSQEAAQAVKVDPPSDGPGAVKVPGRPPEAADGGSKTPVDTGGAQ